MSDAIFDRAYRIHAETCLAAGWVGAPRGIAFPFGVPDGMPPHRWHVSWDVMQALTEAAPPPWPVPNPKGSEGAVKLLFGWRIVVDENLPPDTMRLELEP